MRQHRPERMKDRLTGADIYRYTVVPDSDTAAAHVLRFVGNKKKVLDIGAGPGSIARPLVELNKCRLSAVEFDERSCELLRLFCDTVVRCDLNDHAWPETLPTRTFDAVVIADVLEHLYDPWTTIKLATGLLNEQGSVVVSLPHASHVAILACLLNEDFDYRDWGLLDRTHIRFFGIKNIQALFEGAGLKIAEFAYVIRRPEETEFADAWATLPKRTQAVLEAGEYAHVYQVVIRAIPHDRNPGMPGYSLPDRPAPQANKLKYVAFYLPQFHPIPENDLWWGKGFTEWTNVTKAEPLFPGHYQPHLPADFGFYDLRIRKVQLDQIAYAKRFGIDAFCFHYYWFGGRRLLEGPVEDFLADPEADISFCLCWANENWTRKWDGGEHELLVEQTYSPEGDTAFIANLLPFFRDRRYLRVGGAPVLVVYRPQHMPDARATAQRWRRHCRDWGIGEIHLVAALVRGNTDFEQFGFDAGVEFPPHNVATPDLKHGIEAYQQLEGYVVAYGDIAELHLSRSYPNRSVYRSVVPSWDNSSRWGQRAMIVLDATPENYERWLAGASHQTVIERTPEERLVFINAWNEWAEGCHLEPDRRHGTAFLEATLRVKSGRSTIDPTFVAPTVAAAAVTMAPTVDAAAVTMAPTVDAAAVTAIQDRTDRRRKRRWLKKLRFKKLLKILRLR